MRWDVDDNFKGAQPAVEQNEQPESKSADEQRLDWETPKLIVESVHDVTRGGWIPGPAPGRQLSTADARGRITSPSYTAQGNRTGR